ncbi:MAG: hypothetical protein JW867_09050 [Candidatus Omnitrophica bacterium]|nr:hypothetical protein [Candidatus Omnitrophota bacterium]
MKKAKRRKFFVDKASQLAYMGLIAVPLVVLLVVLYYLIYYSVFNEMLIPEAIASTLLPAMKKVNLVVIAIFPITILLILRMSLIFSNRLVGPLGRIENDLDKIISGNSNLRLKIRDDDKLKTLVSKINSVVDKLDKYKKS